MCGMCILLFIYLCVFYYVHMQWESRELSSYVLLDEILRMVEKSVLPATWLL